MPPSLPGKPLWPGALGRHFQVRSLIPWGSIWFCFHLLWQSQGHRALGGPRDHTILFKVRLAVDLTGQPTVRPSVPEAGLGVGLFYYPWPSLVSRHCT